MNYKKDLVKKIICHRLRLAQQAICHFFTPSDQLFAVSCITIDLLCTMSTLLRTTLWHMCPLVDCTKCSEYFVQLFEPCTWLVCMLACVRLCVTSQLSRATLIASSGRLQIKGKDVPRPWTLSWWPKVIAHLPEVVLTVGCSRLQVSKQFDPDLWA